MPRGRTHVRVNTRCKKFLNGSCSTINIFNVVLSVKCYVVFEILVLFQAALFYYEVKKLGKN